MEPLAEEAVPEPSAFEEPAEELKEAPTDALPDIAAAVEEPDLPKKKKRKRKNIKDAEPGEEDVAMRDAPEIKKEDIEKIKRE